VLFFLVIGVMGRMMLVCLVMVLGCSLSEMMKLVWLRVLSVVWGLGRLVGLMLLISSLLSLFVWVVLMMFVVLWLGVLGRVLVFYVVVRLMCVVVLVMGWLLGSSFGSVLVLMVLCLLVWWGI